MDDRQMWEWLREKRSQKERGSADGGSPRPPSDAGARQRAGASPVSQAEAKRSLRAAIESFQAQQEATGAVRPAAAATERADDEPPDAPDSADLGPPPPPRSKRDIDEAMAYLADALDNYERFVQNIGENGFTAPMLLYYRDEVQEGLDELTHAGVEMQAHWQRTVELDRILREHAQTLVDEIGWANFKQYQIINDPPPQNWWWYLNRETRAPQPPPPFWQFWKQ